MLDPIGGFQRIRDLYITYLETAFRFEAAYPLYVHQAEMLRRGVTAGQPGIVTSGTGSGKTESFLLPVLASLAKEAVNWEEPEQGFLSRRWWQDQAGQAYEKWSDLP